MFTGIIETVGKVISAEKQGLNIKLIIESDISQMLRVDQSVSHNGICLTVVEVEENTHTVIAVDETVKKSNIENWNPGQYINLERAMVLGSRLDGHLVQGHVDGVITCNEVKERHGSHEIFFTHPKTCSHLIIEKGSICINGVSLTLYNIQENQFQVSIIPYTWEHTNLNQVQPGDMLNVEYDILGKYFSRWKQVS